MSRSKTWSNIPYTQGHISENLRYNVLNKHNFMCLNTMPHTIVISQKTFATNSN